MPQCLVVLSLWGSNSQAWEPLDKESQNQGRHPLFSLCSKHVYGYTSTRCIFCRLKAIWSKGLPCFFLGWNQPVVIWPDCCYRFIHVDGTSDGYRLGPAVTVLLFLCSCSYFGKQIFWSILLSTLSQSCGKPGCKTKRIRFTAELKSQE